MDCPRLLSPRPLLMDEKIPSARGGIIFGKLSQVQTLHSLPCALRVQPGRKPDTWQQIKLADGDFVEKLAFAAFPGFCQPSSAKVVL